MTFKLLQAATMAALVSFASCALALPASNARHTTVDNRHMRPSPRDHGSLRFTVTNDIISEAGLETPNEGLMFPRRACYREHSRLWMMGWSNLRTSSQVDTL